MRLRRTAGAATVCKGVGGCSSKRRVLDQYILFVCFFFYLGHAIFPSDIVKYAVFTYTKEAYFRYKLTRERKFKKKTTARR